CRTRRAVSVTAPCPLSLPSFILPTSPRHIIPCYVPPHALHSFPTRRSSDLRVSRLRVRGAHSSAARRGRRHRGTRSCPSRSLGRSEEHTSELQSRFDLVCRLLLEKKHIPRRRSSGMERGKTSRNSSRPTHRD